MYKKVYSSVILCIKTKQLEITKKVIARGSVTSAQSRLFQNVITVLFRREKTENSPGWWLSRLEHCPMHQKFAGLIPSQGAYIQVQFPVGAFTGGSQLVFLTSLFLFLFLSSSPSKKTQ